MRTHTTKSNYHDVGFSQALHVGTPTSLAIRSKRRCTRNAFFILVPQNTKITTNRSKDFSKARSKRYGAPMSPAGSSPTREAVRWERKRKSSSHFSIKDQPLESGGSTARSLHQCSSWPRHQHHRSFRYCTNRWCARCWQEQPAHPSSAVRENVVDGFDLSIAPQTTSHRGQLLSTKLLLRMVACGTPTKDNAPPLSWASFSQYRLLMMLSVPMFCA